jgi:hypothetical protein
LGSLALVLSLVAGAGGAQEAEEDASSPPQAEDDAGSESLEDAQNKALDSTATQWSFQGAWQIMPDYHNDTMSNGQTRPDGATDYLQLRIVAPLALEKLTILPRVTLRHYENPQGESGMGNTEIFALIIPKSWDWGSGRTGIGPLVTLPGSKKVARDEWGYGFAAAVVNSSGKWYYGLLFTQTWRAVDPTSLPPTSSDTNPLGIAPFLNYQIGGGWYVGNGDMVARYDWDTNQFYLPIGVRFGKVFVKEKGSWNAYFEYQTSLIYKDWLGSAVKNSYRFNVTYTIPVG